jgi:hypothetical protein
VERQSENGIGLANQSVKVCRSWGGGTGCHMRLGLGQFVVGRDALRSPWRAGVRVLRGVLRRDLENCAVAIFAAGGRRAVQVPEAVEDHSVRCYTISLSISAERV